MFAAGFAAACGNAPALAMEQQQARACGGGEIARGTVSHIVDGRTFVLDDGREVRLAAIEVSAVPLRQDAGGSLSGRGAADALNALAGGDQILLRRSHPIAMGGSLLMPTQCATATSFSCRGN
jgi:hypothetical protein